MSLFDLLNNITDLCISIQNSLEHLINLNGKVLEFDASMIELSGYDIQSVGKLTELLKSYSVSLDQVLQYVADIRSFLNVIFITFVFGLCFIFLLFVFENRSHLISLIKKVFDRVHKTD